MFSRGRGGGQVNAPVVGMVRQSERASRGGGTYGGGVGIHCRAFGGGFGTVVSHCKDGGGGVLGELFP